MTAPSRIDPARCLHEHLQSASPDVLRSMLTTFLNVLMSAQADPICGAPHGTPGPEGSNVRNDYRAREFDTRTETLELAIPKLRCGSYFRWLATPPSQSSTHRARIRPGSPAACAGSTVTDEFVHGELLATCGHRGCSITARPGQALCDDPVVQQLVLSAHRRLAQGAPMAAEQINLAEHADQADVRRRASEAILDRAGVRAGVEVQVTATEQAAAPGAVLRERLALLRRRTLDAAVAETATVEDATPGFRVVARRPPPIAVDVAPVATRAKSTYTRK